MPNRRSFLMDLRPLTEHPAFARLWIGNTIAGLGSQMTVMAVMLHMYALTASDMAVAMIAVAGLAPLIVSGLYGGMLADFFDRRTVALTASSITWASTALLAVVAWTGHVDPAWLYALSIINSAANSVAGATKSAMTPKLVGADLIPAASALQGVAFGLMIMAGPALGGVLVAFLGYPLTYTVDVVLMLALFLGLWSLPKLRPDGEGHSPGLQSVREGIAFLRRAPNIRTQFVMDVTAMTFGNPQAIFPAVGVLILGGGEVTSGFLTASVAVGSIVAGLFSGRIVAFARQGVGIARAIQVYGVAVALFGVILLIATGRPASTALTVAACAFLVVMGGADNVSSIFRSSMLQQAVPDAYRGRLQGINIVVVTGGPRLGALYYGALASLFAHWVPPVAGGMIIVGVIAAIMRLAPRFRAYDSAHPEP